MELPKNSHDMDDDQFFEQSNETRQSRFSNRESTRSSQHSHRGQAPNERRIAGKHSPSAAAMSSQQQIGTSMSAQKKQSTKSKYLTTPDEKDSSH